MAPTIKYNGVRASAAIRSDADGLFVATHTRKRFFMHVILFGVYLMHCELFMRQ